MNSALLLEDEIKRIMDAASRSWKIVHVSRSAERLAARYPQFPKVEISEMLIKEGSAAKVGMELDGLAN